MKIYRINNKKVYINNKLKKLMEIWYTDIFTGNNFDKIGLNIIRFKPTNNC